MTLNDAATLIGALAALAAAAFGGAQFVDRRRTARRERLEALHLDCAFRDYGFKMILVYRPPNGHDAVIARVRVLHPPEARLIASGTPSAGAAPAPYDAAWPREIVSAMHQPDGRDPRVQLGFAIRVPMAVPRARVDVTLTSLATRKRLLRVRRDVAGGHY